MQIGGGKNTHSSLVIIEHVWNPLCTNYTFPQADGEDTVKIAAEIPAYAAIVMQEILCICSGTDFTCSMWPSSIHDVGAVP
jgi:hypothetical protein